MSRPSGREWSCVVADRGEMDSTLCRARAGMDAGSVIAALHAREQDSAAEAALDWAYPNLHGDVIVRADAAGARVGVWASYDPFGQPVEPVTGLIGTTIADDAVPDTVSDADADYAWVGGALWRPAISPRPAPAQPWPTTPAATQPCSRIRPSATTSSTGTS